MQVDSFVFDVGFDAAPNLKMAAKRYRNSSTGGKYVLVCAHATGMTKELWEPTISAVLALSKSNGVPIREVWSVDWPNHGESAIINQAALKSYDQPILVQHWAAAISKFASSAIPSDCYVVGVGHSAGGTAILFSSLTSMPKSSLILVEPVLITPECFEEHKEERTVATGMVAQFTLRRKTSWPTRDDARKYFAARLPWKIWDRAVQDAYVEHALRPADDGNSVTLKCSKEQEASSYTEMQPHIDGAGKLSEIRDATMVHFILGQRDDSMPRYAHDSIITGQKTASVQWIPNAGHLVSRSSLDKRVFSV
ncbi:hypothetical protein EXIGLDRAFT_734477 [Exidia glandulosa HHB12029]|uniref:AB hydrolase-1 domain-containing protein n=1 Tax=Exidia glandulosa HHB12029 TaxID=1314781 RepID=A0A165PL78_EXIGL|nr:hypothetical protein EXIGLDRAFT_734477 [Exidia glandulosa HHB12029]